MIEWTGGCDCSFIFFFLIFFWAVTKMQKYYYKHTQNRQVREESEREQFRGGTHKLEEVVEQKKCAIPSVSVLLVHAGAKSKCLSITHPFFIETPLSILSFKWRASSRVLCPVLHSTEGIQWRRSIYCVAYTLASPLSRFSKKKGGGF